MYYITNKYKILHVSYIKLDIMVFIMLTKMFSFVYTKMFKATKIRMVNRFNRYTHIIIFIILLKRNFSLYGTIQNWALGANKIYENQWNPHKPH